MDGHGRFVAVSEGFSALFGLPRDLDVTGKTWDALPLSCAQALAAETLRLTLAGSTETSIDSLQITMAPTAVALSIRMDLDERPKAEDGGLFGEATALGPDGVRLALPQIASQSFEKERGQAYLEGLASAIATFLGFDTVLAGRLMADQSTIHVVAGWRNGKATQPFSYDLAISPCREVVGKSVVVIPDRAADLYPEDPPLRAQGILGYVGVPLWGLDSGAVGLLACLSRNPLAHPESTVRAVEWFARRAAAELEWTAFSSRLDDRDRQQQRYQQALAMILRETASEDTQDALLRLAAIAAQSAGVARAGIWRLEDGGTRLRCIRQWVEGGDDAARREGHVIYERENPEYFAALRASRIISAVDAGRHPTTRRFAEHYQRPFGIRSMLDAAIDLRGGTTGVICLESVGEVRDWNASDEAFALGLADIVALRLTEMELRAAEAELRRQQLLMLEAQRVGRLGYWSHQQGEEESEWSDQTFDILGLPKTPDNRVPIGLVWSLFHPDDLERYRAARAAAVASRRNLETEVRFLRPDGKLCWTRITALTSGDIDRPRVFGVLLDVTELVEARLALQSLNAELEDRVRARTEELQAAQEGLMRAERLASLGSMVAGVAHELNTPIGVAVTAISALEEKIREIDAQVEPGKLTISGLRGFLGQAEKAAALSLRNIERAGELVKNFKQVSADQTSQERRRFDLKTYVEDILASLQPATRGTPHRFRVKGDAATIDSYPGAIAQIVTNLVMNSLTHGFKGSSEPGEGVFKIKDQGDKLSLAYVDNGCGMEKEVVQRAFEPFFTTTRGQGGTGLGMTITHNLVTQALGGSVKLTSAPGAGMRLKIALPKRAPTPG